ncbi:Fic family protein [Simiduia curdlanivorans]|uniref:Fic family protein n=1 Tax=Simiduia curdlanivorans TaxID=1492769 RepID=A0ABV8V6D4_9GAMM|nr:Fic family protein [Simiduia curdlanivorans]MDN3638763.1 Fic family protein [Simiduia curdlanivorans]
MRYIWQLTAWQQGVAPTFHWQEETLRPQLQRVRLQQGRLLGQSESLTNENQAAHLDALVQTALRTSEIEGEKLDAASVRSSVVRHLGLDQAGFVGKANNFTGTPQTEALVQLLIDATSNITQPLSQNTLCDWQAALFPSTPKFQTLHAPVLIGQLRGDAPMQVISGRMDKPIVHFEAPPRQGLEGELQRFTQWFNNPPVEVDTLLRAAIAHLWLITLHPFDDGNGRVTRAVTDRALAQAEVNSIRFYSLSAAIMARRREYYEQLEQAQKGSLDITSWLQWFLSVLEDAIVSGLQRFERVLNKTRFWQQHAQTVLSERQIKVLNRLLDNLGEEFIQGINASKYQALAKVSKSSATRELADLVQKKCINKLPGGGRSTRYELAIALRSKASEAPKV